MNKDFTLNGLDFSPEVNLVRYLQSIRKFPILSPEKEYALAVEYKKSHEELVRALALSNLIAVLLRNRSNIVLRITHMERERNFHYS